MLSAGPSSGNPSDELARLRAELATEEAALAGLEDDVEVHAAKLSYLNAEYIANLNRVRHYYEPRLRPLRQVTYAATETQKLVELQVRWLERKITMQDRCAAECGMFIEARDMRPAAEELQRTAEQSLLRAYEQIRGCPDAALQTLRGYESPPDSAIETMYMAQLLRGEVALPAPAAAAASYSLPPDDQRLHAAAQCWEGSRVVVSYNYFTGFFASRSDSILRVRDFPEDMRVVLALEAFCGRPEHSVDALYQCSTPIGCLGQWLHAVRDLYRVRMYTAPTLLRGDAGDNTAEGLRVIQAVLDTITFGTQPADAPPLPSVAPADSTAVVSVQAAEPEAVAAPTLADGQTRVEADLLQKYRQTKKRLSELTRPSAVNQECVCRLRRRLWELDESSREAREKMAATEAEMAAKITAVKSNYDDTMLPLHEQLEGKTKAFVDLLMETQNGSDAAQPPAA